MTENVYQGKLIKKLKRMFPGCVVLKNDSSYLQGMLDLTLLWEDRWAVLEVKKDKDAPSQPNQPYYQRKLNKMSFSAFIYPENEEEVLAALQKAFASGRSTCVSQS